MDKEKIVSQHFFRTGIVGAYETAEADCEEVQSGKFAPCFDDALAIFDRPQTTVRRSMYIEGRLYNISSIFPAEAVDTPTDRMLAAIDLGLKKEVRKP